MASDLSEAEVVIYTKDAENEKYKRDAHDKAKEIDAERSRYYRKCKRAAKRADSLVNELETARSKVA